MVTEQKISGLQFIFIWIKLLSLLLSNLSTIHPKLSKFNRTKSNISKFIGQTSVRKWVKLSSNYHRFVWILNEWVNKPANNQTRQIETTIITIKINQTFAVIKSYVENRRMFSSVCETSRLPSDRRVLSTKHSEIFLFLFFVQIEQNLLLSHSNPNPLNSIQIKYRCSIVMLKCAKWWVGFIMLAAMWVVSTNKTNPVISLVSWTTNYTTLTIRLFQSVASTWYVFSCRSLPVKHVVQS